jgi:hypothetical protein
MYAYQPEYLVYLARILRWMAGLDLTLCVQQMGVQRDRSPLPYYVARLGMIDENILLASPTCLITVSL